MKALVTTDIHLSDIKRDEYRFMLFPFLLKQIKKHNCDFLFILGDITDKKDNHSSILLNRIVDNIEELSKYVTVLILKGNHDYDADPDNPFFKFLDKIDNITFISKPTSITLSNGKTLFFVPHLRDEADWLALKPDKRPDMAFMHQTVTGAINESGRRLDGFSMAPMTKLGCRVYAGDVHKPHTIGNVTYVGPPYHIRFGDDFVPRVILLNLDTRTWKTLHLDCPRKWSLQITSIDDLFSNKDLLEGDQVKITLTLPRVEVTQWLDHKKQIEEACTKLKLEVYGIELNIAKTKKEKTKRDINLKLSKKDPVEIVNDFCKKEKLTSEIKKAGLEIIQ